MVTPAGSNPNKLTFTFDADPTFRYGGKKVDLASATQELKVLDKHGKEKTVTGFQGDDGTFFRLKKTTDGKYQIDVYGSPEQLQKANLKMQGGEVTRARFGDDRFRKLDPSTFVKSNADLSGEALHDPDAFAMAVGLKKRGSAQMDAGPPPPSPPLPLPSFQTPPAQAAKPPAKADLQSIEDIEAFKSDLFNTKITAENREKLALVAGLGNYLTDTDDGTVALRNEVARLLATRQGKTASPGQSPLDFIEDGKMSVQQLKDMFEELSLNANLFEAARQDPKTVLAALGRRPVTTLADGNCFYASLAHGVGGSSLDKNAALEQRRALLSQFDRELSNTGPDRNARVSAIAGNTQAVSIDAVKRTMGQGLDGGAVNADGWGGPDSLALAAMHHQRPVVSVSDQSTRIYNTDGTFTEFQPDQQSGLIDAFKALKEPIVLKNSGFHWEGTEPG